MARVWLADAVLLLHAAFVAWVALGGLAVLRWPRAAWLHLPALAWGVGVSVTGAVCPLTPLEVGLRLAAGQGGYAGGFIERYLTAALYPEGLTREHQWAIAVALVVVNAVLYAMAWRRRRPRWTGGPALAAARPPRRP